MSLLETARLLAGEIGMSCDFCTGSPASGHFAGCPVPAMPRIVAALVAADWLSLTVDAYLSKMDVSDSPTPGDLADALAAYDRALRGDDADDPA